MYGLSKDSQLKTKTERVGDVVTKYKVVKETIDLAPLKAELIELQAMQKPTDDEILMVGKSGMVHPYYEPDKQHRIDNLEEEIARWQSQ